MLKSELHQLEIIIDGVVNSNEMVLAISGSIPKDIHSQVADACNEIKRKWVNELFGSAKDAALVRYIQYHQAGIIKLSDQLVAIFRGNDDKDGDGTKKIYDNITDRLEELLEFLEKHFYKYFDHDHMLSLNRCVREKRGVKTLLANITDQLNQLQVDNALISVMQLAIMDKLDSSPQDGMSGRLAGYINGLLKLIEERMKNAAFCTDDMEELLYRHNFNNHYFVEWYQNQLGEALVQIPEKKKATITDEMRHDLVSRSVGREKGFEIELPSIQALLLELPVFQTTGYFQEKAIINTKGPGRMPLNFSVAQFALFIRLCYLEGCFHVNNISDILRFFTFYFETKKQLNISVKSFGRAFYSADQANAAIVRDFLQRMINFIDKTYFPKT